MNDTNNIRLQHLLPLYLVIFLGFIGFSLMITVFTPLLMHSHIPHRTIILGILLALYPFGQFVGAPLIGALSDIHGRKTPLLISLLASAIMYAGIALSLTYSNLWWLGITSFIAGLFKSNIALALSAISDASTGAKRTQYFGYVTLSASAAYIVGPILGGQLANPSLVHWFNNAVPFWFISLMLFATIIYTQYGFNDTKQSADKTKSSGRVLTNFIDIFRPSKIRRLYCVTFLLYLAIFGFFRCYPMYIVDEFNLSVTTESHYIAWVAVPIVLTNLFLTGWLAHRVTPQKVVIFSGVLLTVTMVVMVIPNQQHWLWPTLFIAGFATALCLPNIASLISHQVATDRQGRVMGNVQALQVVSMSVSGLLGGLIAAIFIPLPLIVLGLCALIAIVILLQHTTSK